MRNIQRRRPVGAGFTLLEAMVAITLTSLAGAALLLAVEASMRTADDSLEQTIALGMAQQLVDECLSARHHGKGDSPYATALGPGAHEQAGQGRERFDDTGDFHGFTTQSAEGLYGEPLGTGDDRGGFRPAPFQTASQRLRSWRQQIEVYYVAPGDLGQRLPAGKTSPYRAVEVVVSRDLANGQRRELARLRRVFAYIPSAE